MPGPNTTFAGLPTLAEGDLPDVPTYITSLANRIDAVVAQLCRTTGGSPTTLPTGNQNLLGVGPTITALQSTQTTQAGQITTLQGQVSTLQTNTAILANVPQGKQHQPTSTSSGSGGSILTIDNVTVPTASYKRLMICHFTCQAGWTDYATKTPLAMTPGGNIGGLPIGAPYVSGQSTPVQLMQSTVICTVPAGNSALDYMAYSVQVDPWTTPPTGKSFTFFNGPGGCRLVMAFLPWSNGPDLTFPHY